MEYIVKELHLPEEDDDEPNFVYSELDSGRLETRRVEFYPNGICFAYGGDMGHEEVLNPVPFPEDLRTLNRPGEIEVRAIAPDKSPGPCLFFFSLLYTTAKNLMRNSTEIT